MRQRKISLKKCKKRKIVKKEENGYTLFTEKWFQQLGIKNFSEKLFERATSWLSFHLEEANIAFRNFAFCSFRKIRFEFDLGAKGQTWNFI